MANASSCIAIHNHPSGDPAPSAADRAVTMQLIAAGRHLGVPLNDHLVIGDGGRFSSLRRLHPECWR
jgi:DNA repair protein RadC